MNQPPCIIITGARGGIGTATLAHFLSVQEFDRYHFHALDITPPPRDAPGSRVHHHSVNVADQQCVEQLVATIQEKYLIAGAVNGAGVLAHGPALDLKEVDMQRLIDVNIRGVINVSQAVARAMIQQSPQPIDSLSRSLLTIASNSAPGPRASLAAYGASKAFASHYTRSLGLEIASAGIRCNVICPGTTKTSMVKAMWGGKDQSQKAIAGSPELYRLGIPLQRIADPADIAPAAVFLMSQDARHITLQELTIDGGATQR
ncbi:SDR family oxidoreductase [Rothia nasisuis]|uniref:SDR family oxidoreductase n=1 Tax=Rothia nasisuis TaxID=2109647 RepID=UPI001F284CC9|nr:SDR family oxidoreductase [Rothia nasisuis]